MRDQKYVEDLGHIKEVMNRSSKSISLTGLSPIAAGIIGSIGAYMAYRMFFGDYGEIGYAQLTLSSQDLNSLGLVALPTLVLGVGVGVLFALLEIKKSGREVSKEHVRRMFLNLAIPLLTGGIVCLILFFNGHLGIVMSLSLIFYGLALINTNKYTFNNIRTLGLLEIALGLLALYFMSSSIIFWGIGFGLLHIIYGLIMQVKSTS